jgi:hypothetical protein
VFQINKFWLEVQNCGDFSSSLEQLSSYGSNETNS